MRALLTAVCLCLAGVAGAQQTDQSQAQPKRQHPHCVIPPARDDDPAAHTPPGQACNGEDDPANLSPPDQTPGDIPGEPGEPAHTP